MAYRGAGLYMIFMKSSDLRVGDWCWDADWGELVWNGDKWETKKIEEDES